MMEPEELLRRVRSTAEAVAAAADEVRGDEAVSGETWSLLDWAASQMEELHREIQYDVLTAPRVGAPTEPGNAQATLGLEKDASEH